MLNRVVGFGLSFFDNVPPTLFYVMSFQYFLMFLSVVQVQSRYCWLPISHVVPCVFQHVVN